MKNIGKKVTRIDGKQKVSGKAVFGNDIEIHGMLYAACKHSDIAAGKVTKIDVSEAEKLEGVSAIALYKDIPGEKKVGPIRQDYLPLIKDEVFFCGDVLAIVAAINPQIAREAANLIKVEYEPYEPVTEIKEALKPGSRLIHPEYKSNIVNHYPLRKGNIKIGFQVADQILTRTYTTGFQEHAYLEPETVTCEPDYESGSYKIYGSIQNPYTTRKVIAMFMGLPLNKINVIPSTLGGSFGGKDDIINNIACRTALLSYLTDKPVQMTYSREESLQESYKRHPYIMDYKVGFTNEGKITAMKINIIADSGAYSSQSFFVTWRSLVQATGPYEIPHVETDIKSVYTNNCYTAAFRGFGSPQVIFAQESLMDEIASHCGLSPFKLREINAFDQDSITASGQKLSSHIVSLKQVMDKAVRESDFETKIEVFRELNQNSERFKKGIGLACSYRGCSLGAEGTDTSSAIVSIQADGSVIIFTGVTENGQGLRTTMSLIAAEGLGIPLKEIVFLSPQTSMIADGGPTVASRGTIAGGNAVRNAVEKIKAAIIELLRDSLNTDSNEVSIWQDGKIFVGEKKIDFKEAVALAFQKGINLSAYGWFKAPDVSWEEESGQGDAYFTYVYGCNIAEITLDSFTGKICLDHVYAAHDLGRVINLLGAKGQVYGGVVQGMGYAYLENFNISRGKVLSNNFDTYLIPTIKDIPEITPILIENPDPAGPYGAKSLGEPALEIISAAINNALYHASGKSSDSLPLSLEKVFLNHDLKKPVRQSLVNFKNDSSTPLASSLVTITENNLNSALKMLAKKPYQILAGGTDLMIKLRSAKSNQEILNIGEIPELKSIKKEKDAYMIGSTVNFSELINNPDVKENFPLLVKACRQIGSTQIRNVATIGGNLVNAAPCADSVPPLIFYNAQVILRSLKEERKLPVAEFINGSYDTAIKPDEILTGIYIPLPENKTKYQYYYQLGRRQAVNITRLSICLSLEFDVQKKVIAANLVAGSLLNKPARIPEIEKLISDRWIDKKIARDLRIHATAILKRKIGKRWSAEYKIPVFINLLIAAILEIKQIYSESQND